MLFITIIAGGVLGVMSVKLVDIGQQKYLKAPPKKVKTSRVRAGIDAVQKLKNKNIAFNLFKEDLYSEQLKELSLDKYELSKEEKTANQLFVDSSLILVSATICAVTYPPLIYLHIPPILYLTIPFYKEAFDDLFRKRRVTTTVVDAALMIGALGYTVFTPPILLIGCAAGWLYALTNKIVTKSKDNTRNSLSNLFGEQPQYVWLLRDGVELEIPFESVQAGDIMVVHAGQMIPVDGQITDGVASIEQHKLTGETQPFDAGVGDRVFAATVVLSGKIYIQVEKTGAETAVAKIGQIMIETSSFTSSIELRGQEIANQAALPTLVLSAVAWPMVGTDKALGLLYSGIGYNMRILGPLSVLNYLQVTAQQGILIKDGRALEQVSKIDTIVFDKTGTLTLEQPHVGSIITCNGYTEASLLAIAAAAEHRQTHPIARAIQEEAHARHLSLPSISDAAYEMGYGIKVLLDQKLIRVGSDRFMTMEGIAISEEIKSYTKEAHEQGHSLIYVAIDDQLGGAIELSPTIRPEAKRIVNYIRQLGIDMYILSGDHERPTRALALELGIEHYFAETLPKNKADLIAKLQEEGKFVCFVGDGINDAIALKKAHVSISLRGASTMATDSAQIILMDQTLNQLDKLFTISKQFESNMQINLMSTVVPGVTIIGGALLGYVGYVSSAALFFMGLGVGMINAMRPLFNTQNNRDFNEEPAKA